MLLATDVIHVTGKANEAVAYEPSEKIDVYRQSGGANASITLATKRHPGGWEIKGVSPSSFAYHELSHAYSVWANRPTHVSDREKDPKVVRVHGYIGTQKQHVHTPSTWFSQYPRATPDGVF